MGITVNKKLPISQQSQEDMSRLLIVFRLLRIVGSLRNTMTIAIFFGVLNHLSNIALIAWGAWLLTAFLVSNVSNPTTFDICLLFVFGFTKAISAYIEQIKNHDVAFRLLAKLRTDFYKEIEPLAPAKLQAKRSGDISQSIAGDIELIEVFFAHTISPVIIACITSTIVLFFLGYFWFVLPLILLPFYILLGIIIPFGWERLIRGKGQQIQSTLGDTNAHLTDSLQGLQTILLFNQGEKKKKEIYKNSLDINKIKRNHASYEGFLFGFINLTIYLIDIIMIFAAVEGFLRGFLTIQTFIIVVIVIISSFGPIIAVSSISHHLTRSFAAAERLFRIIDETPEVIDNPDCFMEKIRRTEIEYKDLTFQYSCNIPILNHFNIQVPQGTSVAIVGESGCGKSTILQLLLRFWKYEYGAIRIGGKDIKKVCQNSIRDIIAVVSQDSYLFNATIRENIAIGKPDATDDEIYKVAKLAHIHEYITSLPRGFNTSIGELGEKLSGGERQRILISRALLKDAPILLLDEPTSYLDTLNENAIQKTLNEVIKEKTVILVTHRLSSLANVDKIFVISGGRSSIIETLDVK